MFRMIGRWNMFFFKLFRNACVIWRGQFVKKQTLGDHKGTIHMSGLYYDVEHKCTPPTKQIPVSFLLGKDKVCPIFTKYFK